MRKSAKRPALAHAPTRITLCNETLTHQWRFGGLACATGDETSGASKRPQQIQTVSLDSGETSVVSVQITAPPGNYAPEVEVGYPPG